MNRTDRLYAIAEELRAAGATGRTSTWLANRYEVTPRTIKRDISALQQSGTPIWATGGPGGGYVLDASMTLPPITFTPAEATALATLLASDEVVPFATDARGALRKVMSAMTVEGRAGADALSARVWVREGEIKERPITLRTLEEAVRQQVVVVIDYEDASGTVTERRPVEPLAFARARDRWFLLAWCRKRRDGRWFRLDRVKAADLTRQTFEPRSLLDVFGPAPSDVRPINAT